MWRQHCQQHRHLIKEAEDEGHGDDAICLQPDALPADGLLDEGSFLAGIGNLDADEALALQLEGRLLGPVAMAVLARENERAAAEMEAAKEAAADSVARALRSTGAAEAVDLAVLARGCVRDVVDVFSGHRLSRGSCAERPATLTMREALLLGGPCRVDVVALNGPGDSVRFREEVLLRTLISPLAQAHTVGEADRGVKEVGRRRRQRRLQLLDASCRKRCSLRASMSRGRTAKGFYGHVGCVGHVHAARVEEKVRWGRARLLGMHPRNQARPLARRFQLCLGVSSVLPSLHVERHVAAGSRSSCATLRSMAVYWWRWVLFLLLALASMGGCVVLYNIQSVAQAECVSCATIDVISAAPDNTFNGREVYLPVMGLAKYDALSVDADHFNPPWTSGLPWIDKAREICVDAAKLQNLGPCGIYVKLCKGTGYYHTLI